MSYEVRFYNAETGALVETMNCTQCDQDSPFEPPGLLERHSRVDQALIDTWRVQLPPCRSCGASPQDHFFTSQRDGTVLCPAGFDQRKEKRLATVKRMPKSPHPLDAWMG